MKKLMIAAAIVCAAAFANAAQVGWSCAGLKDSAAGSAYEFFIIGQKGVTSVAQITALVAKGTDVSSYQIGGGTVSDTGYATTSYKSSGVTLGEGENYTAFMIVFDEAKIGEATQYLAITSEQASGFVKSVGSSTASITFAGNNQATYANTSSNWKDIETVPEPFSGALALLGMGAIALRRKMKKAKKA